MRPNALKYGTFIGSCLLIKTLVTQWGWVTHICVNKLTIIGAYNGLSPGRHQAIICTWTNAGICLIRPLGTNFGEILSKIRVFSFKKMHLKMSSAKWRQFFLGLNVLVNNTAQHSSGLSSNIYTNFIVLWLYTVTVVYFWPTLDTWPDEMLKRFVNPYNETPNYATMKTLESGVVTRRSNITSYCI